MRGLSYMTNTQKAKYLCDLFPTEMAEFVLFAGELAKKIKGDREKVKQELSGEHFPSGFWFDLADEAMTRIKSADKLEKNPVKIAEQLFSGDVVFFMKHCLTQYITTEGFKRPDFKVGVQLFFSIQGK